MTTSPRTGRFSAQRRFDYNRLVGVFDSYLRSGEVVLTPRTRGGGERHPGSRELIRLATRWEEDLAVRELAPATREAYGRVARGYLVYLEDQGIRCLDEAGPGTVTGFFASLLERWAASSLFWVVSNFRPFLKFTGRLDLLEAVNLLGMRRSHLILPVVLTRSCDGLATRARRRGRSAAGTPRSPCWR
ncbi:hypothetical protein ACFVVC_04365 [Pseudarthrobacter sp. NPDC058196]|uniref:hypothetical protein n=1 Tax=Pseudarthrobacter sp. NPDC058196 TaxID=3346376 RepID=UPI0036D81D05